MCNNQPKMAIFIINLFYGTVHDPTKLKANFYIP